MEFYASERIKGAYTLCNSMDGTREHYAKWNKPGGEGQIPYDLTFNWNIINKIKSKQNITRDIEIKNNLTIARGQGDGTVGRRVFRNYYKGHMDSSCKTLSPLSHPHSPLPIVTLFLISMSLVIFCLLFSFVDYVPVKGEIIWYLSLTPWLILLSIMHNLQ